MNDGVSRKDDLVLSRAVVERRHVVRVIEAKLRPHGDNFVRPPRDADGVLGVLRGKAGATADLSFMYSFRTVRNAAGAIRNRV